MYVCTYVYAAVADLLSGLFKTKYDLISKAQISETHNSMYLLGLKPAIFCVKSEMSFLCRNIHTNGITNGTTHKHKHTHAN